MSLFLSHLGSLLFTPVAEFTRWKTKAKRILVARKPRRFLPQIVDSRGAPFNFSGKWIICYERLIFPQHTHSLLLNGLDGLQPLLCLSSQCSRKCGCSYFMMGNRQREWPNVQPKVTEDVWQDEWLNPNPKFHLWIFPFSCRFDAEPLDFGLCLISFESIRRVALGQWNLQQSYQIFLKEEVLT